MDAGTDDEIIQATYRTLCEYGYADLTIQRIADESSLTTAAVHYHFDTKEDLLNAFLQHAAERFEERLPASEAEPDERLAAFFDAVFARVDDGDDDFPVAIMELKAQAPYQPRFRQRLAELDARMQAVVAGAIRDGIDAGQFDDADPEEVAHFVVTAINGSHVRQVALGEDPAETRRMIEAYLESRLGWTPEVLA